MGEWPELAQVTSLTNGQVDWDRSQHTTALFHHQKTKARICHFDRGQRALLALHLGVNETYLSLPRTHQNRKLHRGGERRLNVLQFWHPLSRVLGLTVGNLNEIPLNVKFQSYSKYHEMPKQPKTPRNNRVFLVSILFVFSEC